MLSDNHDLCVLDFINDVNSRAKSKSVKKSSKSKVWKPTGKVFTNIGYTWRPTGRTFTIVGNACPLSRITTTAKVNFRKPTALEIDTPKPVVTLVYSKEPSKSWESIVSDVPSSPLDECRSSKCTVKFGNDHVAKILEYGDYQIGNVTISWVYYVEGLGHNFSTYHFSTYLVHFVIRQMIARTWKLQPKAGIGIFIGYAPRGGARISNFDELTTMASEHSSLEPALHEMTLATISLGLVPNPPPSTLFVPPLRTNCDLLFQPLFDELLNPSSSVDHPAPEVITPIIEAIAPEPAASTGSPSSTTVDQDAPSAKNDSEASSSSDVIPTIVHTAAPNLEHVTKWTKDHLLDNIIDELGRPISRILQLHEQALFSMQEELSEFERLEVWELVPRPDKVMVITLKWIYKVKLDELGGILENKARLVARGYHQEEGINFEESFAPIFGLFTSRLLNAACKKSLNLLKKGLLVQGKLRQLPKGEYRDRLQIADME
ncbi:retrovirus-related pol polyprotein from transposon TNT 1-94 [Tanacetum coccineum]